MNVCQIQNSPVPSGTAGFFIGYLLCLCEAESRSNLVRVASLALAMTKVPILLKSEIGIFFVESFKEAS